MTAQQQGIHWSPAEFDPRDDSFVQDPYPTYAKLRERFPVTFVPALNAWWVTRYSDVVALLQDARMSTAQLVPAVAELAELLSADAAPLLTFTDPPEHTRLRALVSPVFQPKSWEHLRSHAEQVAEELLAGLEGRETVDLVAEFAIPLPMMVLGTILGVPAADRPLLRDWMVRTEKALDPEEPMSVRLKGLTVRSEEDAYFAPLIAQRRKQPGGDLISRLLALEGEGEALTEPELLSFLSVMVGAGMGTITSAIGTAVLMLLQHPDQLDLLRRRPELLTSAVDEILRIEPPVQRVMRVATGDVVVGGQLIRKGEQVHMILGSANRDPEVFANPDRLDITRQDNPHVTFSRGPHRCMGWYIARMEIEAALKVLLSRPRLELATPRPRWQDNSTLRSLESLPVRL